MARVRSVNFDTKYNTAEVLQALNLIIGLTDDLKAIIPRVNREKQLAFWKKNNTTKTLAKKLLVIKANLEELDPRQ